MKGIYIYEEPFLKDAVACLKLSNIEHKFNCEIGKTITKEVDLHALVENSISKSRCNKDDTYDFETGALIALMKMCGVDKIVRACNEAFSEDTFKIYAIKYERELNELKKDFDKVKDLKEYYKKNYEDVREHYGKLGDRNKYLIDDINKKPEYIKEKDEEIKKLKSDKDKSWKNYQRNIQKKQDRINELNNIEEGYIKLREEYDSLFEEKEKLQHEYNLCLNSENALRYTVDSLNKSVDKLSHSIDGYKNDLYKVAKRCKELEEENEKLKLDCEKLQHGYNDMIFCGGRQNGKQYTFLVDLFKKLDQKKVDAAYKEAYDKWIAQPIWQKEVFKQIHKDQLASLLEAGKCLYKNPTKREEMWEKILNASKNPPVDIKVAKQDIKTFLKELQDKIPEAMWNGSDDCLPSEYTNPYWFKHDYIFFSLFRYDDKGKLRICYDDHKHSWIDKPVIEYIAPMRWDLFKKGRLAVKVKYDNYKEFYEACEKELGKKPSTYPMLWDGVTISICKKDGNFEIFTIEHQKKTGRKIVDWEDVR